MSNVIREAIIEYERKKLWSSPSSVNPSTLRKYVNEAEEKLKTTDMSEDAVHNAFGLYLILRENEARVNMLKCYLSRLLSVEEEAWARWNLVDGLAMMRRPDELVPVHKDFLMWAQKMLNPEELFWVMGDATQALTWFLGEFGGDWMEIFWTLNKTIPPTETNRTLRADYHNTAAHALARFERWKEAIDIVNRLLSISREDPSWEYAFDYEMKAYIRLVEAHGCAGDTVAQLQVAKKACLLLDKYSKSLPAPSSLGEIHSPLPDRLHPADILGRRHRDRPQCNPVICFRDSCHNLASVLYRLKRYEMAVSLFEWAMSYRGMSPYLARCYAASLWVVTKDKVKLRSFLDKVSPIFENNRNWWKSISELEDLVDDPEFIERNKI